ncbi:hypothetical protein [Solimonas variicoloris]|uniref:hypothetical protein n=1 Tax=Solimonas variicoloris TaxID=254408 RepID=UPI0003644DB8|nr:hypothetical protein [Solimonas variicoloris]
MQNNELLPIHQLREVVTIPAGTAVLVDGESRTTAEAFTIARNALGGTVVRLGATPVYADGPDARHIHLRLLHNAAQPE